MLSYQNTFSLHGQKILITGGGTGLGLGMAHCLVSAGATVILVGRRPELLKAAAESLGEQAAWEAHDVTRLKENPDFLSRVEEKHGPLDVLINNAGIHLKKPAHEVSDDEFQEVVQTHLHAAFSLTRECARGMLSRGSGHILFIASMASLFGIPLVSPYSAAKTAQLGLVRSLATEFSPKGVRVNAIAPGWIDSEMSRKALSNDPERKRKILSRTPLGQLGDASDIGWAAVYLCSSAGRFVTGACLTVDGGASIGF